jgi:predicted acylesterase/phospholipase RssA/CRP-like cAMP-binding protein
MVHANVRIPRALPHAVSHPGSPAMTQTEAVPAAPHVPPPLAPMFAELPADAAAALSAAMRTVRLGPGATLFSSADAQPSFYVVVSGGLQVVERLPSGAETVVRVLETGEALDELQALAGNRGSIHVRAVGETVLAHVPDADRDTLADRFDVLRAALARVHRQQLFCRLHAVFGTLDAVLLAELEEMADWAHLRRGELLWEQQTAGGGIFLVISGRLRTVRIEKDGASVVLGESGRGEIAGEMAFFGCEPRGERVEAVRDSVLVGFTREEFDKLVSRRPQIIRQVARLVIDRTGGSRGATHGRVINIALVPVSPGVPMDAFAARLAAALAAHGRTLHLTPAVVDARMAESGISQAWDDHDETERLLAWLEARETDHRFVLYQADPGATPWTRRSLRQADRVLLLANAGDDPAPGAVERALLDLEDRATDAYESLVLIHPDGSAVPSGTSRWLEPRRVREHHHLRWDGDADFARLARVLAGRAIGLVLGGGGARGFAHIGVLRALKEAGIPVDYVGGTSMGAAIAAQHAIGMPPEALLEINRRIYLEWKPQTRLTLPVMSLVGTRRAVWCGVQVYGETQIEDLWTPYFAVTSSLTTAEMMVHRRGLLRKFVLASTSIPVFAPPVLEGIHLLVDGALLNNLPTDVMRQSGCGTVIASEVSLEEDACFTCERVPSPWEVVRGKLFGRAASRFPSILEVAMRSSMLHSSWREKGAIEDADLCLRAPIEQFGLMDFARMGDIAEVGYAFAREQVAGWSAEVGN